MQVSAAERLMGVLGYLPFPLFFIPIKARRDSIFVQFHARQGGVLFLLWFAASLLLFILLLFAAEGPLATPLLALFFLATFLYFLLAAIGILKVALGERYRMPVVADVALMMRL